MMSDIADIDIRGKPIFGLTDRCEYIHNIMVGGGCELAVRYVCSLCTSTKERSCNLEIR